MPCGHADNPPPPRQDGGVFIWDMLTGELVDRLHGHGAVVRDVTWHPHRPTLLSASWDGTLGIWTRTSDSEAAERRGDQEPLRGDTGAWGADDVGEDLGNRWVEEHGGRRLHGDTFWARLRARKAELLGPAPVAAPAAE